MSTCPYACVCIPYPERSSAKSSYRQVNGRFSPPNPYIYEEKYRMGRHRRRLRRNCFGLAAWLIPEAGIYLTDFSASQ
jgi:hypothetical protein